MTPLQHRIMRSALMSIAIPILIACDASLPPDPGLVVNTMEIVSGQDQRGRLGKPLPEPLRVRVLDAQGSALVGARVRWTPPDTSHGRADPAESQTGADGIATTTWILGSRASQSLNAHLGGPPTKTFHALADGFTMTCSPESAVYAPGQVRTVRCELVSVGDFSGSVALATASVPAGIEVGISTSSVTFPVPGAHVLAFLQVGVSSATAAGTYSVDLQATAGDDSAMFRLTVVVSS